MKVKDKMNMDLADLIEHGPVTIVAFGDSVTHGAVAAEEMNYETVYWNRLRRKLQEVACEIPINVINAGIGGITAKASLGRMERQVFLHEPDLVIICFGLNDVNGALEDYLDSLRAIFTRCKEGNTDAIFLTPNMLNTYVAEGTEEIYYEYAHKTAEMQNGGRMDLYMSEAVKLADSMGIPVCDCYSEWKKLSETEDITLMLANYINHPTKEMHELFASNLFDMIME
ncbi:MAG: GDSL family lipase [Clostridiales bacterium]|nr:GDSL family lipase [Clostridiales bacterium]